MQCGVWYCTTRQADRRNNLVGVLSAIQVAKNNTASVKKIISKSFHAFATLHLIGITKN